MRRSSTLATMACLTALTVPVTIHAGPAAAVETCDGRTPTIVVPVGPDGAPAAVTGTPGDDVIVGTDGNDTIAGAGGNDTICGLSGADVIDGGPGDDRLFGGLDQQGYFADEGYYGDLVRPGPGDDHVDLGADPQAGDVWFWESPLELDQVSYSGATSGVTVDLAAGTATGEGTDVIATTTLPRGVIGSPHDDHLTGTATRDLIHPGAGDDQVVGGDGHDLIAPDAVGRSTAGWSTRPPPVGPAVLPGDDVVDAGPGSDYVVVLLGSDRITGGEDDDRLYSRSPDTGTVLDGGPGRDRLNGEVGTSLRGGDGRDTLDAEFSPRVRQVLDAGRGRDQVRMNMPRPVFEEGLHLRLDVPRGRLTVDGRRAVDVQGLERLYLRVQRGRFDFVGGPRSETVTTSGGLRVRALGGGGADVLVGGKHADLLDGGPGRDRLDGQKGRDRCLRGEALESCEVRR